MQVSIGRYWYCTYFAGLNVWYWQVLHLHHFAGLHVWHWQVLHLQYFAGLYMVLAGFALMYFAGPFLDGIGRYCTYFAGLFLGSYMQVLHLIYCHLIQSFGSMSWSRSQPKKVFSDHKNMFFLWYCRILLRCCCSILLKLTKYVLLPC